MTAVFPAAYTVKYDERYSYVVQVSEGKLKAIFLAENSKAGHSKIPQTVRIDGAKFSILCDLFLTTPDGRTGIGLANLKGEVAFGKGLVPKIGKHTGVLKE